MNLNDMAKLELFESKNVWIAPSKRHDPADFAHANKLCNKLKVARVGEWNFKLGVRHNHSEIAENFDVVILIPEIEIQNEEESLVLGRGLYDIALLAIQNDIPLYAVRNGELHQLGNSEDDIFIQDDQDYRAWGSITVLPISYDLRKLDQDFNSNDVNPPSDRRR